MGALLSRWRRKQTTIEILESLDKSIKSLEGIRQSNLERQKKVIGTLILFSVVSYIIALVIFYFFYFPDSWSDRLVYSTPLVGTAIVVWLLKRFLHWYFVKRITRNDSALQELKVKKEKILDEVMETETYKKAKEILEKYDPDRHKQVQALNVTSSTPNVQEGQDVRKRTGSQVAQTPQATPVPGQPTAVATGGRGLPMATPNLPRTGPGQVMAGGRGFTNGRGRGTVNMASPAPMPRPILPRERGVVDRLVEYLVGDGPQNRFALICKNCQSHNGMALKEEFEYLNFRCCYCFTVNPARKQKDFAPRLDGTPVKTRRPQPDADVVTGSESEAEEKIQVHSTKISSQEESTPSSKEPEDKKKD